jgi:hypothetical protein
MNHSDSPRLPGDAAIRLRGCRWAIWQRQVGNGNFGVIQSGGANE